MNREPLVALAVTGGIAAYKSAEVVSALTRQGVAVQVLMTENAQRFVTPLTFQTLSRRPVVISLWESPTWRPEHVALADEAALFAVVPATADVIAKLAHGLADDAVSTFGATFSGPTLLAPAMNPKMWAHPACRENVAILRQRGAVFCGPAAGRVACGADGVGRLAPVEEIVEAVTRLL